MSRPPSIVPLVAAALVLGVARAPAQLSDWASIDVSPSAVTVIEQTIVVAVDGNRVSGFSGFSRQWATLVTAFGAPQVTQSNEHFIVRDGPLFYGYSSRTGRFEGQFTFSPSSVLLPNPSPQSWQSVVSDGNDLHVYCGLTGRWLTLVCAATPTVRMANLCLLVDDGGAVCGVSSYYGTPVALPVQGATVVGAWGNLGIAQSPGFVHGFSAHRNTWASMPVAAQPQISNGFAGQPGFVALQDGTRIAFFSGQTGTFTVLTAQTSATLHLHRATAVAVDGNTAHVYSGILGTTRSMLCTNTPNVTRGDFLAVVEDGPLAYAYSAQTGTFAAPLPGFFTFTANQLVATATPSAGGAPAWVYSSITHRWIAAPAVAGATVHMGANAVILADPAGGLHGFAPGATAWSLLPGVVPEAIHQGNSAQGLGILIARVGSTLHAFNPKNGAWRSVTMAGTLGLSRAHWSAAVFEDGVNAYAFGALHDRWSSVPIAGPAVSVTAQIQSASVFDGAKIHAFTALGQMSLSSDYPEYWRVIGQGGRLRLDLSAEPGSVALMVLGTAPTFVPTPWGDWLVDPTRMVVLAVPTLPGTGLFDLTFQIPGRDLSGVDFHFQAAVIGSAGVHFTNSAVARIL